MGAALLVAALAAGLTAAPAQASTARSRLQAAPAADRLDEITFGDPASEQAHAFGDGPTAVVEGANGQKARISRPLDPPSYNLGDLTFTVRVDPRLQNYLSVKFWGGDDSTYKTVVMINGEYVSYRANGDHEPINVGTRGNALPGRFFYSTAMLPLASTQGRTEARITLRTYHPTLTAKSTEDSRRFYQAFTHTSPKVTPTDDTAYQPSTQAAAELTPAEEQAKVEAYRAKQIADVKALEARVDADPNATMSIVRYQDELRFYAESLLMDWSPTQDKQKGLQRIFNSIDNFTRQYYGDVKSLGNGGHQSDWGGYYGALGEALYIVENLIDRKEFEAFLKEPFTTGTQDGPNSIAGVDWKGGELTRGEAWERVLKANFDFARSRLSYIYNQMMYTYEGAWKAHEGLRPMTDVIHAGVAAAADATFAGVAVEQRDRSLVTATAVRGERGAVRVQWSKPDDAVAFDVYRTADPTVAATDPLTAPGWTKAAGNSASLVYDDRILAGELFYKVAALGAASDAVRVTAEGIDMVLEQARAVKAGDYTQASYAAFKAEVDAVEADSDGDEAARVKRVYDAYALLVPVFQHGFEAGEPDIWAVGGSAPGNYQRVIGKEGAHNGERGLFFSSTDTTGNGGYNLWVNSRKAGGISPIAAKPNTRYKMSFDYRLTDYVPGRSVGAYAFIRSFKGGTGVGSEQRNWLPAGDTPAGTWAKFEREYTSVDGDIDNLELTFGLRGSSGTFQVDDVRVEPVG